MPLGKVGPTIERLRNAALQKEWQALADAELLELFIETRDERAFSEIAQRYGALVWSTCRRVLINPADAEDAFQAAFIVLARKASSIRPHSMLAGWLYGVARRAALKARRSAQRRAENELRAGKMRHATPAVATDEELLAVLEEEIQRLPDYYRTPIILCELEGLSRKQVAEKLGWAEGTVASRVARGRALLARRMASTGLSAAAALSSLASVRASALLPLELLSSTIRAALGAAAGCTAGASAQAVVLSEGIIKTMLLSKLKWAASAILALGVVGVLLSSWGGNPGAAEPAPQSPPAAEQAKAPEKADSSARLPKAARDLNLQMLQNEEIRKDLNCTAEQKQKIDEAIKEMGDAIQKAVEKKFQNARFGNGGGGGGGGGGPGGGGGGAGGFGGGGMPPGLASSGSLVIKPMVDAKIKIAKILTDTQTHRLRQLDLQMRGVEALLDRKVIRSLRLTEAQEDAIEEIIEKSQEERSRLRSSIASGQTADPEFKKRGALQEQETKEAVKVLTDEQKRAWKDLIGKEIAPETLLSISGPGMGLGRGGSVQFGGGGGGPGGGGGGGFGGGGGVPNPALEKKKTKP